MIHPDLHLAIYEVDIHRTPAFHGVNTLDQLGPLALTCIETAWLAGPSPQKKPG